MTNDNPPFCAVLTPPGRSAVATVAVHGLGALAAVQRRFHPASRTPFSDFPTGRAIFGRFRTTAGADEELVIGLLGPNQIEVHCHGGSAAVEAVCDALAAEGCRRLEPAQWLRHTETDPIAAAAMLALAEARTERTAAILLDQYRGALSSQIAEINRDLCAGNIPAARQTLKNLLARADLGLHLAHPWRVVLAGRPNAGKSSLMNAIVGYERAIVFEQPGTTRDVLTATTAIDGWPVELADTAGLRAAGDSVEAAGVARAWNELAAADAVLLVADTTAPWDTELFARLAHQTPRLLLVHNKSDLLPPASDRPVGIATSAKIGTGLAQLCDALANLLVSDPSLPGEAAPFTPQQVAALRTAANHVQREDTTSAQTALEILSLRHDYDSFN